MLIETIIRKLKNDPDYEWKGTYSTRDLLAFSMPRAAQAFRGSLYSILFQKVAGLLFMGRNVCVKHGYMIRVGKNLILEDNVSLNGLSTHGINIGDHVSIARDGILFCTGVIANKGYGISIGHRTGIAARVYLAGQGGITIGNDVIMGPDVKIFSEEHNYDRPDVPIKAQGETRKAVIIGNNCWLGAGSTILAGVTIGDGCVIAAGSVVTRSIPADTVVAGVPAKIIKPRIS